MAAVGFAVLGLGTLAQTAILPAFQGMQQAKLVALVSRDLEKARRLGEVHGAAFAYDSLDECLPIRRWRRCTSRLLQAPTCRK